MGRKRASERVSGRSFSTDSGISPAQRDIRRMAAKALAEAGDYLERRKEREQHRPELMQARMYGRLEGMAISLAAIRRTNARVEMEQLRKDFG